MSRVNVLLLLVLMTSAIYLVRVGYDARHSYTALDQAQGEEHQLALELDRLKAEKQAQATPLRVERMARDRLAMRPATPAITQYVVDGADAAHMADAAQTGATVTSATASTATATTSTTTTAVMAATASDATRIALRNVP